MSFAEITYAARSLRRSPGLIAVAALSLGLGIGVNTLLYSVFQDVFLQPPSAADPGRLVRVEPGNSNRISYANYRDLSAGHAFSGLAAFTMTSLPWRANGVVESLPVIAVSPTFFEIVAIPVLQGRPLAAAEERGVVITNEFWKTRLNARGNALGSLLNLNGQDFAVLGILPPGHRSLMGALGPSAYVIASRATVPQLDQRGQFGFTLIGRLQAGVTSEQAASAITAQGHALERIYPADDTGWGQPADVFPVAGLGRWRERGVPMSAVAGLAAIPFVIFGLVLLIACANVAGLLLARAAGRSREIAIRLALGASRYALVRMLLAESLLLALLGAASGLLLNVWLCSFIAKIPLPQAPGPLIVTPDFHALAYALALAMVTTLLCGLTPAWAATQPRIQNNLRRDASGLAGRLSARRFMVVAQVAASVILLFLSTLFLRSLAFINGVNPGFDIDHVVTAQIDLSRDMGTEQRMAIAQQARAAVAALPGIRSVSYASLLPLGGDSFAAYFQVDGISSLHVMTFMQHVGTDYFRTSGTPLLAGRDFSTADRAGAPGVAVVNEEFVRAHACTIGSRVRYSDKEPWLEIVGIAANSKYAFFGEPSKPILYRPFAQAGGSVFMLARTAGSPAASVVAMKSALSELPSTTPILPRTMRDATSLEFELRRLGGSLLATVGLLGLLLSMIGLYGIMAYVVNRRTMEIGIRMALGATRPAVLGMVLRDSLALIAIGLCVGLAIAVAVARPLPTELITTGVSKADPLTLVAVAGLLLLAGMAASYVPASRATQIPPAVALRSE